LCKTVTKAEVGHGCGKLLQETAPGVYNFDKDHPPINPVTNKPVTSWYKPGQTWSSVFGGLAGAYEVAKPLSRVASLADKFRNAAQSLLPCT